MGTLRYTAIASLDGYVNDTEGRWDWCRPSPEVHAAVNALQREHALSLLGRRMYEVLTVWETMPGHDESGAPHGPEITEFTRLWRGHDKIVYSRTLAGPETARTRVEREFVPDAVRELVARTDGVVAVAGAELAGQALRAGLVDEVHLFVSPVIVGGGTRALPHGARVDLALTGTETFPNGVVHLRYVGSDRR